MKNRKKGRIEITGLEAVRSDVAPITTTAQEEFAETLRMDDSEAREHLYPKLRNWAQAIRDGDIDIDRVCKRGGIGQPLSEYGSTTRRPSPIYRGAKYANEHIPGVTIQRGDKPMVIYIDGVRGEYPNTYQTTTAEDGNPVDAVSVSDASYLPEEFDVDWNAHWHRTLKKPMKPLLETRFNGDAWSEILHQHEQANISAFEAM